MYFKTTGICITFRAHRWSNLDLHITENEFNTLQWNVRKKVFSYNIMEQTQIWGLLHICKVNTFSTYQHIFSLSQRTPLQVAHKAVTLWACIGKHACALRTDFLWANLILINLVLRSVILHLFLTMAPLWTLFPSLVFCAGSCLCDLYLWPLCPTRNIRPRVEKGWSSGLLLVWE